MSDYRKYLEEKKEKAKKEAEEVANREIEEMLMNIIKFGRHKRIVLRHRYETLMTLEKMIMDSSHRRHNIFSCKEMEAGLAWWIQ